MAEDNATGCRVEGCHDPVTHGHTIVHGDGTQESHVECAQHFAACVYGAVEPQLSPLPTAEGTEGDAPASDE